LLCGLPLSDSLAMYKSHVYGTVQKSGEFLRLLALSTAILIAAALESNAIIRYIDLVSA